MSGLRLGPADRERLRHWAASAYPEEACALIVGRPDGAAPARLVPCANVAPDRRRRFEVDPAARIRLEKELRQGAERLIGVWHSHPDGPAAPSATDAEMVYEPDLIWLISGYAPGRPMVTRAFRPRAGDFDEISLDGWAGMEFRSDNTAGACPEIMAALARANEGTAASYGADPLSEGLARKFADLFEREVAVFPVATGTAANSLALAAVTPPWGVVYAHRESHIEQDECGAPTFFTGGAKLALLDGPHAKFAAADLDLRLAGAGAGVQHHAQPAAVSITQASERGAVYAPAEIAAIGEVCRRHKLALHMDGARFGNALAHLGCSAAEITWKAGVDVLSFGATKNGALAAEAVVFFDPGRAGDFLYVRKRAGHLFSKMRFLSAQLDAYLAGGLWLRNARQANAMAARLAAGLAKLPGARVAEPVEANEVFVDLPEPLIAALEQAGIRFHRWEPGGTLLRLVTAWCTQPEEVDRVCATAEQVLARHAAE